MKKLLPPPATGTRKSLEEQCIFKSTEEIKIQLKSLSAAVTELPFVANKFQQLPDSSSAVQNISNLQRTRQVYLHIGNITEIVRYSGNCESLQNLILEPHKIRGYKGSFPNWENKFQAKR